VWCIRVCTVACYSIADSLVRFEPVTEDPGPVWIRVRYEPDTLAIRGATHRTIHRSVLVRAVKIRWRFRSETALCHVSICFYWVFRCYSIGRERSSCLFNAYSFVIISCKRVTILFFNEFYFISKLAHDDLHHWSLFHVHVCSTQMNCLDNLEQYHDFTEKPDPLYMISTWKSCCACY